jgi:hypothetical protein
MFFSLFPHLVRAQEEADLTPLKQFIFKVEVIIINPVILLGFAIALLVFLYGVFEFIRNGQSSDARATGGQHILWGVIGMFIMIAAGGIMNVICGTLGITTNCNPFS